MHNNCLRNMYGNYNTIVIMYFSAQKASLPRKKQLRHSKPERQPFFRHYNCRAFRQIKTILEHKHEMSSKRTKTYSASYIKPICFQVTGMIQTADSLSLSHLFSQPLSHGPMLQTPPLHMSSLRRMVCPVSFCHQDILVTLLANLNK